MPCTLYTISHMVTCSKTRVQRHKQDIDIDTICCYDADFPSLPVLICTYVCLALCHFITCSGSFIYHQDQNTEYLATQGCLLLPFYSPISHPWEPLICPLLLKFCHFKKYYKWTHTACSLWELAFLTEPKFPGGPSQSCASAAHPFLLLSSNPWCGCPRFVQPFTHWSVFGLLLVWVCYR